VNIELVNREHVKSKGIPPAVAPPRARTSTTTSAVRSVMPPAEDRNDRERARAVEMAVGQIEKQFGKGAIMRLGQKDAIAAIPAISTGSVSLDYALGIGGVPKGRVIEIFGPESSGKTTLTLQIIAEAQKLGGMAAFVDAEHALDAGYARKLGVDLDNLLVSQPDNGEQALEIVEVLIRSNAVDVVVVDSVAALVPRAEIDGEMGEAQMGLQARLMSQALRKLTGAVSKSKTSLIFINQLREKIGVMFGNPETTTGGRALKFYASVRIDIRRIGAIKDGDQVVGGRTRVKVVKNKVAPPFREAEFDVMYGEGISKEGDLLDLAVERKIVEKSGTWFAYSGERLGQGRENVKQFLKDNPAICKAIEHRVRAELGLTVIEAATVYPPGSSECRARVVRPGPPSGIITVLPERFTACRGSSVGRSQH
jgi:recombination protein RecA